MTDFDDRFADRVREAFDAYEEPVDEAAWARMQASLASGAAASGAAASGPPRRAGDRAATGAATRQRRRALWVGSAALAALVLVVGVWLVTPGLSPEADAPALAVAPPPDSGSTDAETGVGMARAPEPSEAEASEPAPFASGERSRGAAPEASPSVAQPAAVPQPVAPRSAPAPEPSAPLAPEVAVAPPRAPTAPEAPLPAPVPDIPPPLASGLSVVVREAEPRVRVPSFLSPEAEARAPWYAGVSLVAASTSAFSGGRLADGVGGAAGVVREVGVARGVSVSGGALAAYNRFTLEPAGNALPLAFGAIESDPSLSVDVPNRSTLTTFALEIPLDVALDVLSTSEAASASRSASPRRCTSRRGSRRRGGPTPPRSVRAPRSRTCLPSYTSDGTRGPFRRVDLARQLNLALRPTLRENAYDNEGLCAAPARRLASQNLGLATLGLRLRVALR